jgi:transcriptional regulator with XRE-family HTH domain
VTSFFKRSSRETLHERALLQEIDERHFISEQVFRRREQAGWSQEELAAKAGMTQAQVAVIEAGQANPTLRSLVKLAQAFGCSVSELTADPTPLHEPARTHPEPVRREWASARVEDDVLQR